VSISVHQWLKNKMNSDPDSISRRPLKSRSTAWAKAMAGCLDRSGISPNFISFASIVFACLGAVGFVGAFQLDTPFDRLAWLLAAAGIQLRLLCNLMDGMVAVEGGKKSPTGELWNELPDRLADAVLLCAVGWAAGLPWVGALCAMGALLTAYIRALGTSLTGQQDFQGPMAKPHRMAVLTVAALLAAALPTLGTLLLTAALALISAGLVLTLARRIRTLARRLNQPAT